MIAALAISLTIRRAIIELLMGARGYADSDSAGDEIDIFEFCFKLSACEHSTQSIIMIARTFHNARWLTVMRFITYKSSARFRRISIIISLAIPKYSFTDISRYDGKSRNK